MLLVGYIGVFQVPWHAWIMDWRVYKAHAATHQ